MDYKDKDFQEYAKKIHEVFIKNFGKAGGVTKGTCEECLHCDCGDHWYIPGAIHGGLIGASLGSSTA